MKLLPIGIPGGPPSVGPTLRGVAIHWAAYVSPPPSALGRKLTPLIPEPAWQVRQIPFRVLTLTGADRPPATTVETERMIRHAATLTAVQHAIPANSPVYYEVGK